MGTQNSRDSGKLLKESKGASQLEESQTSESIFTQIKGKIEIRPIENKATKTRKILSISREGKSNYAT